MTKRKIQYWVIPPESDSEFVASMENVLDIYALPYNESIPVVRAEKVILVCHNLNTHTRGAFYEAFPAEKAREIVKRIDFHYTPKHGSWLNISENELSSMTRECLKNRRIGNIDALRKQTETWATCTNTKQRGVDWQFTIGDARRKLKSAYPQIKE